MPTCPKCGYNVFMSFPAVLLGGTSKAHIVCCGNCHSAIGVLDTEELNEKLDIVLSMLTSISRRLQLS